MLHSRTKHIELDLYFVREKVVSKELIVNHVRTIDQVVDVLTKAFQHFQWLKEKLTVTLPESDLSPAYSDSKEELESTQDV